MITAVSVSCSRRALLAVALIGALVVHLVWDVSLGIAQLIFFVGWPIVGAMVTIDDDLPGWLEQPGRNSATGLAGGGILGPNRSRRGNLCGGFRD
jgi:hypothetical protein